MLKNLASIFAVVAMVAAAFTTSAQAQRHGGARGAYAGGAHVSGVRVSGARAGGYYGRGYRGYGRYGYRYRGGAPYWGWGLAAGTLAAAPYPYYNGNYAYAADAASSAYYNGSYAYAADALVAPRDCVNTPGGAVCTHAGVPNAYAAVPSGAARGAYAYAAAPNGLNYQPGTVFLPGAVAHNGEIIGRDPDPNVRLNLMKDPNPMDAD